MAVAPTLLEYASPAATRERPPSSVVTTGLFLIALVLALHFLLTAALGRWTLTPPRCLKVLCLFRLLSPESELRIAGGREIHLGSLQPLGLFIANSIFVGDYLTTRGQSAPEDWKMIRDLGFEIEGGFEPPASAPASGGSGAAAPGSLIRGGRS